jgi:citrate lyase subunit alpha/citrate CoA-transferase
MAADMTMVISPLIIGRIPTIVYNVNTVITPGASVDVIVTDAGVAVNPAREDLKQAFADASFPVFTIDELKEKAYAVVGQPKAIEYGEKVVALIEYRDGTLIDVVRNI